MRFLKGKISRRIQPGPSDLSCFRTYVPLVPPHEIAGMRQEMTRLREFHALAKSIVKNSKGEVLLTALRRGFAASVEAQKNEGAATIQQKAIIFTESRRTQEYLFRILETTEFAGRVMLFTVSN